MKTYNTKYLQNSLKESGAIVNFDIQAAYPKNVGLDWMYHPNTSAVLDTENTPKIKRLVEKYPTSPNKIKQETSQWNAWIFQVMWPC